MHERERRLAQNEALFREVNERVREINEGWASAGEERGFEVVCECATRACTQLVEVSPREYEAVRANPTRFIVVRGHEEADVERVVEERDDYYVVAKVGVAQEIAIELDPRRRAG